MNKNRKPTKNKLTKRKSHTHKTKHPPTPPKQKLKQKLTNKTKKHKQTKRKLKIRRNQTNKQQKLRKQIQTTT